MTFYIIIGILAVSLIAMFILQRKWLKAGKRKQAMYLTIAYTIFIAVCWAFLMYTYYMTL